MNTACLYVCLSCLVKAKAADRTSYLILIGEHWELYMFKSSNCLPASSPTINNHILLIDNWDDRQSWEKSIEQYGYTLDVTQFRRRQVYKVGYEVLGYFSDQECWI